jgi:hypothetical protein
MLKPCSTYVSHRPESGSFCALLGGIPSVVVVNVVVVVINDEERTERL